MLTMYQTSVYMLYSTNFNSPKSPRTQVLIMNLVVKVRNLWHERVDNLPKVRQVKCPRSHTCPNAGLCHAFWI